MKQWLLPLAILACSWISAADPINTCSLQSDCFSLSVTQTTGGPCVTGSACSYRVCVDIDSSKENCAKAGATISHGCFSPNDGCDSKAPSLSYDFGSATTSDYYPSGFQIYNRCFDVKAGDSFYFIMKDGSGQLGCAADLSDYASLLSPLPSGSSLSCAPTASSGVNSGTSCSGKGNIGKECVWKLVLPACTNDDSFSDQGQSSCQCNDMYRTTECLKEENEHVEWEAANVPNCDFETLFNSLKDKYECTKADCGGTSIYCNKNIPPEGQALFTNCQEYIKRLTDISAIRPN